MVPTAGIVATARTTSVCETSVCEHTCDLMHNYILLYFSLGQHMPPKKCRFPWEIWTSHVIHGSHASLPPKRHLDRISCFAGITVVTNRQKVRRTPMDQYHHDHAACNICSNSPHLYTVYRRCELMAACHRSWRGSNALGAAFSKRWRIPVAIGWWYMRSRVYEMVYVCLSRRTTAAAVCGGFAAERPVSRKYRSTAGAGAQRWH